MIAKATRRIALLMGELCILGLLMLAFTARKASAHWTPPQALTWYWQLDGTVDNGYSTSEALAYDIDLFDNATYTNYDGLGQSQTSNEIPALHKAGHRVICYIDVGTYEPNRPDSGTGWDPSSPSSSKTGEFPHGALGNPVQSSPGEYWLDIRSAGPYYAQIQQIMIDRFILASQNGCDAVEPDNIDGVTNHPGTWTPATSTQDQLSYDEWIANLGHYLGMAVLQKNWPEEASTLEPDFDGVLSEQCNQYSECSDFQPYLNAGKPVLNAEYADQNGDSTAFCGSDSKARIMGTLYTTPLNGTFYQPCWDTKG